MAVRRVVIVLSCSVFINAVEIIVFDQFAPPARYYHVVSVLVGVHPVREALKAGRTIDRVLIAKGAGGPRIQEIVDLCRERSVPVRFEQRSALDRAASGETHQGIVAFGAASRYAELSDVVDSAQLLVILDGVEDPHNLGRHCADRKCRRGDCGSDSGTPGRWADRDRC